MTRIKTCHESLVALAVKPPLDSIRRESLHFAHIPMYSTHISEILKSRCKWVIPKSRGVIVNPTQLLRAGGCSGLPWSFSVPPSGVSQGPFATDHAKRLRDRPGPRIAIGVCWDWLNQFLCASNGKMVHTGICMPTCLRLCPPLGSVRLE